MTERQPYPDNSNIRVQLHAGSAGKAADADRRAESAGERKRRERNEPMHTGTSMEAGWMPYPESMSNPHPGPVYEEPANMPNANVVPEAAVNAEPANAEHKAAMTKEDAFESLLLQLQEVDFALVELTLYLDTHPYDMQAIQQFNQLAYQRAEIAQRYEQLYGPLLQYGHSYSQYPWQWNDTPWPWQV